MQVLPQDAGSHRLLLSITVTVEPVSRVADAAPKDGPDPQGLLQLAAQLLGGGGGEAARVPRGRVGRLQRNIFFLHTSF